VIDSHCHLADAVYAADLAEVVTRARADGVAGAMCILSADEPEELDRAAHVRSVWPDVVFAAGVHPHRAGGFAAREADSADVSARALDAVQAVAVGEIGLDYHYTLSPRDVQGRVFAAQLELARSRSLPVVIHTREATDDTWAALRSFPTVRAVLHCFTGTLDEARVALDLGHYVSMSGIVTFPRAHDLREVAAFIPEDRLLVETDAPFLAPVPFRGKRNEPAWVARTLGVLAEVRGVTSETLAEAVQRNFARFIRGPEASHAR
jgi:TatD DNase family protein